MENFEKLGAFYLGKTYDLEQAQVRDELLLLDSKDLTTHAVCVGMTGSGKTGLCLALLEEAAIDGVPAIAIDPKGDLGNLALAFPRLEPADFLPWIDESDAARAGMSKEQFAAETASRWRNGLAQWGQTPERIARFRDAAELVIYTPGSSAGVPLSILQSFNAPAAAVREDDDALSERIQSAASGLLALLGVDADPIRSREHILISNLFSRAWREGRDLDLAQLIREIQDPPLKRLGVFDLETFFPGRDRLELAMRLNNLLASPSFASWIEGEPLDIRRLLYTPAGKPKLSVISIAHLSDVERMFIVTLLLNEIVAWTRGQTGTSSLRALVYMDEVFGYFPPVAEPPSKKPMLTLLKQARAFGVGVVLATQNPVDLDYKGLSNIGAWFLGRLQTERDKARVLEGLEGASASASHAFDRRSMEETLAGLGSRVFLLNNVHEDAPVVFHSRWALSYLRGPLTRGQIKTLMDARRAGATPAAATGQTSETASSPSAAPLNAATSTTPMAPAAQLASAASAASLRPLLPPGVAERFLVAQHSPAGDRRAVYQPALLGKARLHFARASYAVDQWREAKILAYLDAGQSGNVWEPSGPIRDDWEFEDEPESTFPFAPAPAELSNEKTFALWTKELASHLYRTQSMTLWECKELKLRSSPGETEGEFRIRLAQQAKEKRDLNVGKLHKQYAKKLATLKGRIQTAEAVVQRESQQYERAKYDSVIRIGSSLLGAMFGRKLTSATNVTRASTSMRSVSGAAQQRGDVGRAQEKLDALRRELKELEEQFEQEITALSEASDVASLQVESLDLRPRKSDIQTQPLELIWTPWQIDAAGVAAPLFEAD